MSKVDGQVWSNTNKSRHAISFMWINTLLSTANNPINDIFIAPLRIHSLLRSLLHIEVKDNAIFQF